MNKVGIQSIPENWDIRTIEAINKGKKRTIKPEDFPEEKFRYFSIPAYQENKKPTITFGKDIGSAKIIFEDDAVVFGKLNPRVEKVWRISKSDSNARNIGSTEWIPIFPDREKMDINFLYFLMWSSYVMYKAKRLVSGSTPSRQRVDQKSFYKLQIPIPPLPEQQKIASVLSTVQEVIEQTEAVIQAARQLKKSMMKHLFTYGPIPVDQSDQKKLKELEAGDVPFNWEIVQLKQVVKEFFSGGTPSTKNKKFWNGDIDFTTTKILEGPYLEKGEKKITIEGLNNSSSNIVPPDNILIGSRVGVGKCVINSNKIAINQDVTAAIIDAKKVNNLYLVYYFQTNTVQNYIDSCKKGSTIKGINRGDIQKLPLKLPSFEVQKVIAGNLYVIDQKINQEIDKKKSLETLFNSLLESLMTAKIRVV